MTTPQSEIINRFLQAWNYEITLIEPSDIYDTQPQLNERYTRYSLTDREIQEVKAALTTAVAPDGAREAISGREMREALENIATLQVTGGAAANLAQRVLDKALAHPLEPATEAENKP